MNPESWIAASQSTSTRSTMWQADNGDGTGGLTGGAGGMEEWAELVAWHAGLFEQWLKGL